jgi:hypothetical protein
LHELDGYLPQNINTHNQWRRSWQPPQSRTSTSWASCRRALPRKHGSDSGDLKSLAGGVGWRLSVKELLDVMNHMRRMNTIVSVATMDKLLDKSFGVGAFDSSAGRVYGKGGACSGSAGKGAVRRLLPPRGAGAVLFVNSPITAQDLPLSDFAGNAYLESLSA